jgi:hypothetical protein
VTPSAAVAETAVAIKYNTVSITFQFAIVIVPFLLFFSFRDQGESNWGATPKPERNGTTRCKKSGETFRSQGCVEHSSGNFEYGGVSKVNDSTGGTLQ